MARRRKQNNFAIGLVVAVVLIAIVFAILYLTVEKVRTPVKTYVMRVVGWVLEEDPGATSADTSKEGQQTPANPKDNEQQTPDTPNENDHGGQSQDPVPDTPVDYGDVSTHLGVPTLSGDEFSIHFLELGNKYTGDCTLLKVGDVEILIDAGSRTDSSATIVPYIRQYCTDGKLEYVVVTHAHQDHIAGFVGSKAKPGVFDSFEVGTIIEFAKHNSTSAIYNNYLRERDEAVERGATLYTALQCYNETDGASRTYTLAEGVNMTVLYNYYYDHNSGNENNFSVCTLFTAGDKHFLFTGDLEAEGEKYLIENNDLPKVELFKGGHHGSYTANSPELMAVIQPKVVCVCCCCNTPEYMQTGTVNFDNMFPSQAFFDSVLPYTELVFVTSFSVWDEVDVKTYSVTSMNGNIVILTSTMDVYCSASAVPVTRTEWFETHRKSSKNGAT